MSRTAKVWHAAGATLRIQCKLRPSGSVPAVFNADDTLQAGLYQSSVEAPVLAPTVGWATTDANNQPQTGYDQGQVMVTLTATQAALLQGGVTYNLEVERCLAADTGRVNPEAIASIPISVRRKNAQ